MHKYLPIQSTSRAGCKKFCFSHLDWFYCSKDEAYIMVNINEDDVDLDVRYGPFCIKWPYTRSEHPRKRIKNFEI